MRVFLLFASMGVAAALVADETTISGENNDLTIERRQVFSVSEMSTQIAAMAAGVAELRQQIEGGSSPLLLGAQAIANNMLSQSNDNFVRATTSNQTLANIRTMVDNAARNMTENAQAIRDEVAEQARQIDRSVSTQISNLEQQVNSNLILVGQVQEGISRAAAANEAQITAATTNITALAARDGGKMISYQQCEHRGANGADSRSTVVLTCTFRKTRADTYWVISHNADTRQINGHSEWRIEVDGQPCTDRANNNKGSLDASFHGAGPNMHRPMYTRGICYRTSSVGRIAAGNHAVRWRQTYTSGDSYWGWNSNARLMVEEWAP